MAIKIALFGNIAPTAKQKLIDNEFVIEEFGEINNASATHTKADNEVQAIIIRGAEQMDEQYFDLFPNLKIIARQGAGYDNVPIKIASEHNVIVTNAPGANAQAVAETSIMLALIVIKKFNENRLTKSDQVKQNIGRDLSSLTVGIAGFGHIGQKNAQIAKAFGANVIFYNRSQKQSEFSQVDIPTLFAQSDVLILNLPAVEQTINFVNQQTIELMPDNAIIVNTGRGELIDSPSLLAAIQSKKIAGVGLDVVSGSQEMIDQLLAFDQVTILDHVAGLTKSAIENIGEMASQNVIDYLVDHKINNQVF